MNTVITESLLKTLQNRLKVGNRRGVHLNAVPGRSRYKMDLTTLRALNPELPEAFVESILSESSFHFKIKQELTEEIDEERELKIFRAERHLNGLINQTNAIDSERGTNPFGFGFPLLVRRDRTDNKLTVAPLLIWSLKAKQLKSEVRTWSISRNEDSPIYLNEILINHLLSDSNISIEQLNSKYLDDGLIDEDELAEICQEIIAAINGHTPSDFEKVFKKRLSNVLTIKDKAAYEKQTNQLNKGIILNAGLFSIFEVQKQNIIRDYEQLINGAFDFDELEKLNSTGFHPISSVDTDPSQQHLLNALTKNRNLLIQGPPGTGKSQSLSAILVNALSNHKKVLVVCEKQTALQVLYQSLSKKGLEHCCFMIKDVVKDRRGVVNQVRELLESENSYDNSSKEKLDEAIYHTDSNINKINRKHLRIDRKIIGHRNWTHTVGEFLASQKKTEYPIDLQFNDTFVFSSNELTHYTNILSEGQGYYSSYKKIESKGLIQEEKFKSENPFELEQAIKHSISDYQRALAQIDQLEKDYKTEISEIKKQQFIQESQQIQQLISKNQHLMVSFGEKSEHFYDEYTRVREEMLSQQWEGLHTTCQDIDSIYQKYNHQVSVFDPQKLDSFFFKIGAWFSKSKKEIIDDHQYLTQLSINLKQQASESLLVSTPKLLGTPEEIYDQFLSFKDTLYESKSSIPTIIHKELDQCKVFQFLSEPLQQQTSLKATQLISFKNIRKARACKVILHALESSLKEIQHEILEHIQSIETIIQGSTLVNSTFTQSNLEDCNLFCKIVQQDIKQVEEQLDQRLLELVDTRSFFQNPFSEETQAAPKLTKLIKRLHERVLRDQISNIPIYWNTDLEGLQEVRQLCEQVMTYLDHPDDLFSVEYAWLNYFSKQSTFDQSLINQLKPLGNWVSSFLTSYLNQALLHYSHAELHSPKDHYGELLESLKSVKQFQPQYIKNYWSNKRIENSARFNRMSTLNVENLYNKRGSKNHKRLSLRRIVDYDIDLFTSYFPIVLTTPEACSTLFLKNYQYFDIVMFDEASQLRVEDNFPAMLKGKQIIIAGDEHQMPPSNFFAKMVDDNLDEEEEEDSEMDDRIHLEGSILTCESLLEMGSQLSFKRQYLDFHYRSKHPYLIDFSNHAFYNSRLKPLPKVLEYCPIEYIQVDGTYVDRSNLAEAQKVIDILEHAIHPLDHGAYPGVGVATLNTTQRDLILDEINKYRLESKDPSFGEKMDALESAGFFVKNLENIQGDERDIIILSTTFGRNEAGQFHQRFGPINQSKGYKLLNVIVTRAKYKLFVCTSIPESTIYQYAELLQAQGENNKRPVFYAYLAYAKAVSEGKESMRKSVLAALDQNAQRNDSTTITPHLLESPFEEEVYAAILDHFDTGQIGIQHQVAGFRIDLVYYPKDPNKPTIAIECDGASYHSSREAYLYDLHRQKILESYGFVFHRIWSTDWWRNAKRETLKLVDFIRQVEQGGHVSSTTVNGMDRSMVKYQTDEVVVD